MANSDFSAWTQKSSKWVFGGLVAIMALSLVVSFGSGGLGGCGEDEGEREAGAVFDKKIKENAYYEARRKASAYWRWSQIHSGPFGAQPGMIIQYVMRQGRFFTQDPKPAELDAKAFEILALRHYAGMCGITASKEEVTAKISALCASAQVETAPLDEERYKMMIGVVFDTDMKTFESFVPEMLVIDKVLDLALDGPSVDFRTIIESMVKEERKLRVCVRPFDPIVNHSKVLPPGPDEILTYFEANKTKFQVPEKYQVEFLLADVEKLKEKQGEPTEEELRKFYDTNKAKYTEPAEGHDEHDGHDHGANPPQGRQKPYEDVKDDVRKQVQSQKAQRTAYDGMLKVNAALGERQTKLRRELTAEVAADPNFKDKSAPDRDAEVRLRETAKSGSFFNELLKEFEGQILLTNDISLKFTDKQPEDLEKRAGKADSFQIMNFAKTSKAGSFSPLAKTDKGAVIFRLNAKDAAYTPDCTGAIKEQIIRLKLADKLRELTVKQADELVKQINSAADTEPNPARKGYAKVAALTRARNADPAAFRQSSYFKTNESSDYSLGEMWLATAVKTQMTSQPDLQPGFAVTIRGEGEKKDWGFVAVLDDVVTLVPDDGSFWSEVLEKETQEKSKRREQKVKEIVLLAAIVDKSKELGRRN